MTQALFDAHFHIIEPGFPLIANQGYLPEPYPLKDYLHTAKSLHIQGGAVVSGSFQGFDQAYLAAALQRLGPGYVGVTQLPADSSDEDILGLDKLGVRAVRFNLYRGGSEKLPQLASFAARVFELCGWHVELYADAADLESMAPLIARLPAASIDHLGFTAADGLPTLLRLVEQGVRVKASGFGRLDFPLAAALQSIHAVNPGALMFGTDLPGTRAPGPFRDSDIDLITDTLGPEQARAVLADNARAFYRL